VKFLRVQIIKLHSFEKIKKNYKRKSNFGKPTVWTVFLLQCHFDVKCQISELFKVKLSKVSKNHSTETRVTLTPSSGQTT